MIFRILVPLIELGLLVYCLIDCVQTDSSLVRGLSKGWWVLLIIVLPLVGGIAWLAAGRPERAPRSAVPWRSTATAGYPEYERPAKARQAQDQIEARLREDQASVDREHEDALRKWEDSLRRREQQLRPDGDPTTTAPPTPDVDHT